jgi:hypothetical protein
MMSRNGPGEGMCAMKADGLHEEQECDAEPPRPVSAAMQRSVVPLVPSIFTRHMGVPQCGQLSMTGATSIG